MMSYLLRLEMASHEQLDDIILFLEATMQKLGVRPSATQTVMLAVVEGVSNILRHGYQGIPGFVEIEMQREGGALVVYIRDHARRFDPTQVSPPDISLPLEQRPIGGLGVHLMRKFMDEVRYQVHKAGGNELICTKRNIFRI